MLRNVLRNLWKRISSQAGSSPSVNWGSLRRLEPVSRKFGFDRGEPIDRYYIKQFLSECSSDIHGRVLEVGDNGFTTQFGGARVVQSDVLHAVAGEPGTTIVGDLQTGSNIPENAFDCFIATQLFHVLEDYQAALSTSHRLLKPGGVLLATFPGISQISRYDMDRWGDYWRFTDLSIERVVGRIFGPQQVSVRTYGNVCAAVAFLQGLSNHELTSTELNHLDQDYQVTIAVRAVKGDSA